MILAMMVVYVFALHLIFNVFKWVTPSTRNKIYVTVIGLFLIYCILLVINVYQPMSTDLRVFRYIVPVSATVSGQVIDVPIEANVPLKRGDVLFQIDREPFEAQVDKTKAALRLANISLARARELKRKKVGPQVDVDRFTAEVEQLTAQLAKAKYDLEHTTVRAPADGRVSDIALRPGQVVGAGTPVMTFVNGETYVIGATFRQEVINRIKPGDEAEVALDTYPGRTLAGTVRLVDRDIAQGQVVPSGQIVDTARAPHGFIFVDIKLENDEGLTLAAGEAGAATIYTDRGRSWVPVRKVFFRWYTWMNFIITEMDIRGKRQP